MRRKKGKIRQHVGRSRESEDSRRTEDLPSSAFRLETKRGIELTLPIHSHHPLGQLDSHAIVLAVTEYFAAHYPEIITIPHLSHQLGISLLHIETAFDSYKGKTTIQALLEYRLNRLCDRMAKEPSSEIRLQIQDCGLESFLRTNTDFIEQFGIDILEYHQQCFLAAADRLLHQSAPQTTAIEDDQILEPKSNRLLTRFHQYESPLHLQR
ncbi:MAG: hypothetical protein RLZZ11_873 [Cyanobacteriota bacterium]|jgi:AraC-like DNA-binding protein